MNPTISLDGHHADDAHCEVVVEGPSSAPAIADASFKRIPLARPSFRDVHVGPDGHKESDVAEQAPHLAKADAQLVNSVPPGGVSTSDDSQTTSDVHRTVAVVAHTPGQASVRRAHPIGEPPARVSTPPAPAMFGAMPMDCVPGLADPFLALAADVLDDLEKVRIANENRYRQLTRDETDADGEERGFGLTEDHPDVKRLRALVDALVEAEHQATLNLKRMMRQHPLGPWVKQARGVGEKQAARLLAAIGDPYFNTLHNRPRTVSELWSYCGYHVLPVDHGRTETHIRSVDGAQVGGNSDHATGESQARTVGVAASRSRGQKANWSADAKMRAFLVAESCMKNTGPYRGIYDMGREKYAAAVHQVECKRCGPSGKPALPGSPISAGHQHARALRLVAKAVLKDLWIEAKRLHELRGGPGLADTQKAAAAAGTTSQEIA